MRQHDDVTLGEVYRAVLRIEEQTTLTNGRLRTVEATQAVHGQQIQDLRDVSPTGPSKKQLVTLSLGSAGLGSALIKLAEHFMK